MCMGKCCTTTIHFQGINMNIEISCAHNRFLWFMGYIPHFTKSCNNQYIESGEGVKSPLRMLHSAYSKSIHEFVFLNIFNKNNFKEAVNSCEHS